MKPTVEQIGNLLSHRSDLRPEEGYWQDFLRDFHHNQRLEATSMSAPAAFFARIRSWFSEVSPSKWAYGAGLAYASATMAFILVPRDAGTDNFPSTPVSYPQVVPAPALEQLQQLNLDPSVQGNAGDQVF